MFPVLFGLSEPEPERRLILQSVATNRASLPCTIDVSRPRTRDTTVDIRHVHSLQHIVLHWNVVAGSMSSDLVPVRSSGDHQVIYTTSHQIHKDHTEMEEVGDLDSDPVRTKVPGS